MGLQFPVISWDLLGGVVLQVVVGKRGSGL